MLRLLFLGLAICLSFQVSLMAQTYATPELKQQAEAEQASNVQKIKKEQSAPVIYAAPVDLNRHDLYKLVNVDAVDINNRHTAQEMKAFQAEAEGEFAKMNIVVDWKTRSWYFIPRDKQIKPVEKKFRVDNDRLQFMDCRDCQDNTFAIGEHTHETLTLHIQPQDEGQFFVFSFTFKK